MELKERLIGCFKNVFPDIENVDSLNVDNTPEWDSVKSIVLILVIEEEFGIQIDYTNMDTFTSFENVLNYIVKNTLKQQNHTVSGVVGF